MIHIDPGAADTSSAMALFRNVLAEGTLAASSEAADGAAANALGPQTFDFWTPTSLPATLAVALPTPVECDAAAVVAHDLGTKGAVVRVQRKGASRTNVQPRSDLSAGWSAASGGSSVALTPNAARAPDGTMSMATFLCTDTAFLLRRMIGPTFDLDALGPRTASLHVRPVAGWPWVTLVLSPAAAWWNYAAAARFNLLTGQMAATTGHSPTFERLGDGTIRISVSGANAVTGDHVVSVILHDAPELPGDWSVGIAGAGIELWGAQVEDGGLTSYIPTGAAAVTSDWHDASGWIAPADDSAVLVLFQETPADGWRLAVTGPAVPHIGVAMIGPRLPIPRGITPEYVPLNLARQVELLPGITRGGQFLGTRVQRVGAGTSISLAPQDRGWIEGEARPFIAHYNEGLPFVWAGCPDLLPDDVGYCWRSGGTLQAAYGAGALFGTMGMEVQAHV